MRFRFLFTSFVFLLILSVFAFRQAQSEMRIYALDPVDDLQKQIDELAKLKSLSEAATTPLQKQVEDLENKISSARAGVARAQKEAVAVAASVKKRELDLAVQYQLLSKRVHDQYKYLRLINDSATIISNLTQNGLTKSLVYRDSAKAQDQYFLEIISQDILKLNQDKKALEQRQVTLSNLEKQLDSQAEFFKGEIAKAKDYQKKLSGQIAQLTARQQQIINARSGGFIASIGDSELADDYNASIKGFRESAPAGSFAVFAFGAHTHRKGMSQYGARGRAESGQDYKTILKAYYGKEPVNKDTGGNIKVAGQGEMEFETKYLYGIAEMPASWHQEALKAQAVAARTYAWRYKREGKEICVTEACQVFRKSKADSPPAAWKDAVDATRGQVLEDVVTFYASTHGGFASPIGWDTTDANGGGNFVDKAYDKIGGSPWLYKAWYTKGYSPSSDKCGRSNPWLTGEELADIINAARYRDERVTPVTTSCWGGSPYSFAELRAKTDGPSRVTAVRVEQGNGSTSRVIFQTDKGEIALSGSEFKTAFNLRAPGYLSIPQSGFAFYNIEYKN